MQNLQETDTRLEFPHTVVLKASAGSGKTHALTKRFVQFILSARVPHNELRGILAVTFSNNAAREMKERVLEWLKGIAIGRPESIRNLGEAVSLDGSALEVEVLKKKADALVGYILTNYSDFQIKTIDSFMASVFKASALDLGVSPAFELLMDNAGLMRYAFDLFLRRVRDDSPEGRLMTRLVNGIEGAQSGNAAFMWEPSAAVLEMIRGVHSKVSASAKGVRSRDLSKDIAVVKNAVRHEVDVIEELIETSGLTRSSRSGYANISSDVRSGRFADIIERGFKIPPVNKPAGGKKSDDPAQPPITQGVARPLHQEVASPNTMGGGSATESSAPPAPRARPAAPYEAVIAAWERLRMLIGRYAVLHARSYWHPYLTAYEVFRGVLERAKKQQGKVFIEDINAMLANYLDGSLVPDVYIRLGETIFHYLIDEFQDTSPVQWKNLHPLIENSLSQGGSLFVVGDTKQAIYGFREADYGIMKSFEAGPPFPSAGHVVRELNVNYRSLRRILEFNDAVFKQRVASDEALAPAARRSGLTDYNQSVRPPTNDGGADDADDGGQSRDNPVGYVEVVFMGGAAPCVNGGAAPCVNGGAAPCVNRGAAPTASQDAGDPNEPPEKQKLQDTVDELLKRGYRPADIAVLALRNEDVVRAAQWLSQRNIPFISYSSLDIRSMKITAEIVSLLNFLDSPVDDLAFAGFCLGGVFGQAAGDAASPAAIDAFFLENRTERPLYKAFSERYPDLWKEFFEALYKSAGYMPLYDLVTESYRVFKVFDNFSDQEAVLIKILEVIKDFEDSGSNDLRGFLDYALEEPSGGYEWNVNVPRGIDAVSVMSVHKAKGLGFPVVIALLYGQRDRGFTYVVEDNPFGVELLKINRKIVAASLLTADDTLSRLYDEERSKELVNRLNTLYVGFTRAMCEMYVLCVADKPGDFPLKILPEDLFAPSEKPANVYSQKAGACEIKKTCDLVHRMSRPMAPAPTRQSPNIEERLRGEFIHRVLSFVRFVNHSFKGPDIEEFLTGVIVRVNAETGLNYPVPDVREMLMRFLSDDKISGYFSAARGRSVLAEHEFSDANGSLYRMDRVVVDDREVTVLDFKTGSQPVDDASYTAQVRRYMKILGGVYPGKTVRGVIAYVDAVSVVDVGASNIFI